MWMLFTLNFGNQLENKMGYRKVNPPIIVDFFTFSAACELHISGENWEHICLSRSKIKQEKGLCLPTDCPLTYTASIEDLEEYSDGDYARENPDDYSVLFRDAIKPHG